MTLATCSQCGSHVIGGDSCPHCGTPTPSPSPDLPRYSSEAEVILEKLRSAVAPKYQVRRILGYGGMAGVYLADEPRLGRQVAIKVMSPSLMADPKLVDRFGQEASTIAQLSHPNIITIYEVDDREELHYFTMTYVGGRTLGQVLSESIAPLPVDVVLAWFYQIADALAYAHQHGVVHRDVKPGNVLLDARGNAVVTDFGIAKVADSDVGLTRTGMLVGTPAYMSPEQCKSARVTGASDQYSLGAVLYQMLTGQRPFAGDTMTVMQAHVYRQPTPVLELRPDCPGDLARSVERMLQKQPADRWPTLSAAIAGAGATPPGLDGALREQLARLAAQAVTLEISSWPAALREGSRERISACARDAAGNELTDRRVEWRPEYPAVISVLPENVLLATAPGHTTVEATCGSAAVTLAITVDPDPVRDVEVVAPRRTLAVFERLSVNAIVHDLDGTPLDDRAVLWSSSDPETAIADGDGVVVGVRAGEFVLTASTGGKFATVQLTVTSDVINVAQAKHVDSAGHAVPEAGPPATEPGRVKHIAASPVPALTATPSASRRPGGRVVVIGAVVVIAVPVLFAARALGRRAELPPTARAESTVTSSATPPVTSVQAPVQPTVAAVDTSARPPQAANTPNTAAPGRPQAAVKHVTVATPRPSITSSGHPRDSLPSPAAPPAGPPPASLDIRGDLPAGAAITVAQPDGKAQTIAGRSITLSAGNYVLQFSAPGYETDRQDIRLSAGESQSWTPVVREVAKPRAVGGGASPAAQPPVEHDKAADLDAIESAIRAFAAALDRRDTRAVLPLLSSDSRNGWQFMLENRNVRDFSARLDRINPTTVDGDAAIVDFRVHLSFHDANQGAQQQDLRFTGSATRSGTGWRLSLLRPNS
jgi:serine/threonine-protein kinase